MSRLLATVARTIAARDTAHHELIAAIRRAHARHSWAEIAKAAGLSRAGVRYLATREEKTDDQYTE